MMLFVYAAAVAQPQDYARADQLALLSRQKISTLPMLDSMVDHARLQLELPEEKARFVFTWMAHHLEYDCDGDLQTPSGGLEDVLRSGRSTCAGYSSLMNYALRKMGLESVTIRGVARTSKRDLLLPPQTLPRPNHSWNAVKIRGEWKLLDATWASGEASENCDTVIRSFSPFYFFPDPALLVLSHLPSDSTWQLLVEPLGREKFMTLPVFHDPFYEAGARSFFPEQGVLRLKRNELVRFRFSSSQLLQRIAVWSEDRKDIVPEFGSFSQQGNGYEYAYRAKYPGDYFISVSLDGKRTALVYRFIVD